MDRFPGFTQYACTIAHAFGSMKFKPKVPIAVLFLNISAIKDKACAGCAMSLKDHTFVRMTVS